MNDFNNLRDQVYSTTHTPRQLLVTFIKMLAKQAKQLPVAEREAQGDKGEDIASDILICIVRQDWIDHDTADDLEEIAEIAISLERSAGDHALW